MPERTEQPIVLKPRQIDYLRKMATEHNMSDASKVVRAMIDHAMSNPDLEDQIFGEIRCMDC